MKMKRKVMMTPTVREIITIFLLVKIIGVAGQTTCNNGLGRVLYERLPNQQLQGFDDDVVRDSAAPFRVLEKCQDLCLRDRTATNNLVRACTSFDFQPGSRIAAFSGGAEYEESTCYLTREQAAPEGIGNLMLVPNSVHFTEVCLTSSRPERECPSRRYVFERHPRKKLKLPISDIKEMTAANRSDCEDKCLSEFSFVCRSANYDSTQRTCTMTRYTRRTHPELLEDDPNSDYLENTCLNAERRCDGLAVFIKEENKRLGGPFEVDIFNNMTLEECQTMCLRAEKYFCRSVEFDDQTKQCILSEEDSVSQKDDISISSSPSHHFYDLVCLDNPRASEYPDNSVTSHLFSSGRRPDTAFQRYRNSRLGGEFHSEITGRSLSECLDECLRQTSFQCRSAVYSDRFRTCRLSRYNQRDGMRIIYDADYDYYENLMLGGDGVGGDGRPDSRPDNSDWRPGDRDRDRDRDPNRYPTDPNRYPPYDRYPSMRPGDDRYPGMDKYPGDDRYPNDRRPGMDRYPGGMDRYPGGMDRYPDMERYPGDFDRHPGGMDRYPGGMDRYPGGMDRYPGGMDRYPGGTDRYPGGADRYPGGADRYPGGMDRYPYERYPPMDRYPPIPDNHLPDDRRYPGRDRDRYPSRDRDRDRYPFPDRTPPGRYSPVDKEYYPGDRYMPGGSRYPPSGSRYPMIPDDRYPMSGRYPQGRYPDVAGGRLKPDRIPPVSDNRFPVGNDRNPTFIYKYGNRERFPSGTGYDRFPPPYFDRTFPDRGYMDRGYLDRGHSYYGSREFGIGERYPMERPGLGRPPYGPPGEQQPFRPPMGSGYDNSLGPYGGDGFGGYGPQKPYFSKCDDNDGFRQTASRHRLRRQYVKKSLAAPTLIACQRECSEIREFMCRSFNYRDPAMGYEADRDRTAVPNCELSDRDTRDLDLQNPSMFDAGNFDFYERSMSRSGDGDCLDVSQTCNEDGMEFTLRTPEGFQGRIYTYGFYDRCFFRGNGGTVNVLRITGQQGYPECGTQRNGDSMTNIVVVQFSDHVQTGKDKRFNLTCIFRGPGEAVVTSGYIGAGSGSPIPIEYLPAENTLSSKVRLMILYQGRPTTTIAVGDPLTFRLEAQDGYNQISDIFATNVIARDPYSGRSIQLIDRYGCPVDPFVFPELDKSRDGDTLEARFNAFKIPESNFLVFEATVRSCRDGCQPAYCPTGQSGRSEPSFGKRRRRSINDTAEAIREDRIILPQENVTLFSTLLKSNLKASNATTEVPEKSSDPEEMPEHVHEMIEVFDSRDEIDQGAVARKLVSPIETVCMSPTEYHGLLTALVLLILLLLVVSLVSGLAYRKYWIVVRKNVTVDRSSVNSYNNSTFRQNISTSQFDASGRSGTPHSIRPGLSLFSGNLNKTFATGNLARMCQLPVINPIRTSGIETEFDDPSEPIYTDPSLFERSRSLGSVAMEDLLEEQSDSQKTKN